MTLRHNFFQRCSVTKNGDALHPVSRGFQRKLGIGMAAMLLMLGYSSMKVESLNSSREKRFKPDFSELSNEVVVGYRYRFNQPRH
ncbi:hypothetical protein O9993_00805 [Vibrio lentus]|nr:hypothetical protein [Vibrio lentus]